MIASFHQVYTVQRPTRTQNCCPYSGYQYPSTTPSQEHLPVVHLLSSLGSPLVSLYVLLPYVLLCATVAAMRQGERRFYLAGMVDDLFLGTGVFEYDGSANEGAEVRKNCGIP